MFLSSPCCSIWIFVPFSFDHHAFVPDPLPNFTFYLWVFFKLIFLHQTNKKKFPKSPFLFSFTLLLLLLLFTCLISSPCGGEDGGAGEIAYNRWRNTVGSTAALKKIKRPEMSFWVWWKLGKKRLQLQDSSSGSSPPWLLRHLIFEPPWRGGGCGGMILADRLNLL